MICVAVKFKLKLHKIQAMFLGVLPIAVLRANRYTEKQTKAGLRAGEVRMAGGPTGNKYLMQFQSDILDAEVQIPEAEELSGIGAAYMAGIAAGLWDESIFLRISRETYSPAMEEEVRENKRAGRRICKRFICRTGIC